MLAWFPVSPHLAYQLPDCLPSRTGVPGISEHTRHTASLASALALPLPAVFSLLTAHIQFCSNDSLSIRTTLTSLFKTEMHTSNLPYPIFHFFLTSITSHHTKQQAYYVYCLHLYLPIKCKHLLG